MRHRESPRTATGVEVYDNDLPVVQNHNLNGIDRQTQVEKTKMIVLPWNQATRCVSDSGGAVFWRRKWENGISAHQADAWRAQDEKLLINFSQPRVHRKKVSPEKTVPEIELTESSTQDPTRPSIDGPRPESTVSAVGSAVTRFIATQELPASLQQTALRTKWSLKPATALQLQITHGANGHNATSYQMQGISGLLQCQCSCKLSGGESVRTTNHYVIIANLLSRCNAHAVEHG